MNTLLFINFLKSTDAFKYLDIKAIGAIIDHGQLINCSDGDVILTQGKFGDGLYILVEGKMAVTIRALGKEIVTLATLSSGQFFGEVNLLQNTPCTATVKSLGKSTYFLLKKSSFDMFYVGFPEIRYQISQALIENVIQRQRIMRKEINSLSKMVLRKKVDLHLYTIRSPKIKLTLTTSEKIERFAYLETIPFFNLFNSLEFHQFIKQATVVEFTNKFTLIKQNLLNQSCYFILSGAVTVGVLSKQGYLKVAVLGPNKLICSTSLLDQQNELFVYKTAGPAILLEITVDKLEHIKREHKLLWYKIHDTMTQYLVSLQNKLNTQIIRMASENY